MNGDALRPRSGRGLEETPHELFQFMQQVSQDIAAEYARIRARAAEDPGTAGDEGEENWADLLRGWLPATYHVTTKGRLLSTTGRASPQVDVIVLRPSYPPKLLTKKVYLAEGVAAAFECKVTLRAKHLSKAVETAAILRKLLRPREGTPYRELSSSLIYGVLAHSHDWKNPGSGPDERITETLVKADLHNCSHPREMLNLVCVADIGTWSSMKTTGLGPAVLGKDWPASRDLYGYPDEGGVSTLFVGPRKFPGEQGRRPTPIGVMFAALLQSLAWEDPTLRPIADYFRLAGMFGSGEGMPRIWSWDVYTTAVRARAESGELTTGREWDEWGLTIL